MKITKDQQAKLDELANQINSKLSFIQNEINIIEKSFDKVGRNNIPKKLLDELNELKKLLPTK